MMTAPQDFVEQERSLYRADNKVQYDGFVVRNYENEDPVLGDISGFGWLTTSVAKTAKAHLDKRDKARASEALLQALSLDPLSPKLQKWYRDLKQS